MIGPWIYPATRYDYGWYDAPWHPEPTDVTGDVSSTLAKRAAGDDAWDSAGVVDVSNQLRVIGR